MVRLGYVMVRLVWLGSVMVMLSQDSVRVRVRLGQFRLDWVRLG